jgi:tRNA1Val (adenine37-N6)-methyltransferase
MARKDKDLFQFKQFSIRHDRCVHKVGTDGVLLGAWVDINQSKKILDVGTGTGVIALMLAQRSSSETQIDAIDISSQDCVQAIENVAASPWPMKVSVHHSMFQKFESGPYDLIVSNPPFFINSAKPPRVERSQARHTESLPPEELLYHSKRMLAPLGKLALILPANEAQDFISLANTQQWHCTRLCEFRARPNKPIERYLFELEQQYHPPQKESLVLYERDNTWSSDYVKVTQEFYLKI